MAEHPAEASNILAALVLAFFVTVFAGGAAIICNHDEPVEFSEVAE